MDQATKEKVLRFLVDYYLENGRQYGKPFDSLCRDLPELEPDVLKSALLALKNEQLVFYRNTDDDPVGIGATPAGIRHFRDTLFGRFRFTKRRFLRRVWMRYRWDLIKVAIGAVLGVLLKMLYDRWR
ncbi:MAG: hypothetical protein QJR06_07470 [Alicyclobacillaceae bacterium]|nr:hypothetical protein [Alicyclobacillaceae bacterium]